MHPRRHPHPRRQPPALLPRWATPAASLTSRNIAFPSFSSRAIRTVEVGDVDVQVAITVEIGQRAAEALSGIVGTMLRPRTPETRLAATAIAAVEQQDIPVPAFAETLIATANTVDVHVAVAVQVAHEGGVTRVVLTHPQADGGLAKRHTPLGVPDTKERHTGELLSTHQQIQRAVAVQILPRGAVVAAISPQLFRRQDQAYRVRVASVADRWDAMMISNRSLRVSRDWIDHPIVAEYSLTSDWDDRWRTGGSLDEVIDEAHLSSKHILEGIERFVRDRERRLEVLRKAVEAAHR